jgi:hypothetical protein
VYEQNGEVWLEKRVEEYVLTGSDLNGINTGFTHIQLIDINKSVIPNIIDNNVVDTGGFNIITSITTPRASVTQDSVENQYKHWFRQDLDRLFITVPTGTYADLAAAQAAFAGTVVQYQLATPQLINLTQEGKVDGELAVYENGTVYNTSDTFHADLSFDVASNRSAQISGLLDSSVYQAKLIDSKASKVQEAWIEPTLLNGYVNNAGGYANAAYFKDEFGFVHLRGRVKDGTTTNGTILFNLPVGYRPLESTMKNIVSNNSHGAAVIRSTGNIELYLLSGAILDINLSFYVGL